MFSWPSNRKREISILTGLLYVAATLDRLGSHLLNDFFPSQLTYLSNYSKMLEWPYNS